MCKQLCKRYYKGGHFFIDIYTIGNIIDEAVHKYIKEQAEESRKEDSRITAL